MIRRKIALAAGGAASLLLLTGSAAYAEGGQPAAPKPPPPVVTAGPAGLDMIEVTAFTAAGGTGEATVLCPASHPYVTGGGGQACSFASYLIISRPVAGGAPPQGWEAAVSPSPDGTYGNVTASALCSK